MKRNPPKKSKFEDRVRFNWGFHDAASDHKRGFVNRATLTPEQDCPLPADDMAYRAGYRAGFAFSAAGLDCTSSELAWKRARAHGLVTSQGEHFTVTGEVMPAPAAIAVGGGA